MKSKDLPGDDLREEYRLADFPEGLVRGKYAHRTEPNVHTVQLDPDVAEAFPTSEAVNEALRKILPTASNDASGSGKKTT